MERTNIKGNRFYKENGILYPSVTSILSYYPKGEGFYNWISRVGAEEASRIRDTAGEHGNNIHKAIEQYVESYDVTDIELSSEEYELFKVFTDWFDELGESVEIIAKELPVLNREHKYAGTIDLVLKIGDEVWIVDIKTSNHVHTTHKLQLSAYKHCGFENAKLGIVHLKSNSFIEVEDNFDIFLAVKEIFDYETNN